MFKLGRTRPPCPLGLVASAALIIGSLGGCAAPPVDDGLPQVVASVYPLAWVAAAVVGDAADVVTLVPPGTEPHDYELTPRQIVQLGQAALVVYQRGVDAAIDAAIDQAHPASVVETGSLVDLLPASGEEAGTSGPYAMDPHTWLDPANMVVFARAIADALTRVDPAGATGYRARADAVVQQLSSLDADLRTGLGTCRTSTFLTTHAAFGYLARAYGLTQLAIAGVTPEDEPSPRRLAELAMKARDLGLTTVFFETLVSPAYATTLADDLGLRTDVLDPIEGVSSASRGADYLEIMRANLESLRTANGCAT